VIVRRERPADADAVRTVHRAAFGGPGSAGPGSAGPGSAGPGSAGPGTGGPTAADEPVAEVRLVDELRADGDLLPRLCLVAALAEAPGRVVGSVVVSRGAVHRTTAGAAREGDVDDDATDDATGDGTPWAALGPIGVLPSAQGRGVGSALVHAVLAAADALDLAGVALLGDPRFYARFGFVAAADLGIRPPVAEWAEHFQVRPLTAGTAGRPGTFRYPPAFARI
jgi:putative acetyltransferase